VSRSPQGKLEMWLEILTEREARLNPPKDISPPAAKPFELRVVIWETKEVALKDDNKSDIFVSCQIGTDVSTKQETDTHWNAKDGYGSFNWRMKFPVELPNTQPRLKIALWDKDLVSANDSIGEALVDLSRFFKRAYKTGKGFELADQWLTCYHPNSPGVSQGSVKVTIELIDKAMADAKPNGLGRDEPNVFPHLPKPNRPESSFNPLNPLGWLKLGTGALMRKLKWAAAISLVLVIIFIIIYVRVVL
jgi:hypothetical protein